MKNIRIIETDVDVSGILRQLEQYSGDWGSQKNIKDAEQLDSNKYTVTVDVLQLIVGGITKEGEYVGNTEICQKTPAYEHHTEVLKFVFDRFKKLKRCAFLSLPVGQVVGTHIDEGTYYLTKDRYHLSIQGKYEYNVGDEKIIVEPGTFFWFNNKLPHSAINIGEEPRITFVFDVPHHKKNL